MPIIAPCLWFDGQAEMAANFYVSVFRDAVITGISRYGDNAPFPTGTALMVQFRLGSQKMQALNGGPNFTFNEAISLSTACASQAEADDLWHALTENGGKAGRCGWLKDKFGVSWQIVPDGLAALLADPDPQAAARAGKALMTMTRLDLAELRRAARGG